MDLFIPPFNTYHFIWLWHVRSKPKSAGLPADVVNKRLKGDRPSQGQNLEFVQSAAQMCEYLTMKKELKSTIAGRIFRKFDQHDDFQKKRMLRW
ncbi:hypothetical protein TNCV_5001511 [Trichonephila clavipes]|nr:hypothetical protein TNCV_5001511 [Trichonephila clavipes]